MITFASAEMALILLAVLLIAVNLVAVCKCLCDKRQQRQQQKQQRQLSKNSSKITLESNRTGESVLNQSVDWQVGNDPTYETINFPADDPRYVSIDNGADVLLEVPAHAPSSGSLENRVDEEPVYAQVDFSKKTKVMKQQQLAVSRERCMTSAGGAREAWRTRTLEYGSAKIRSETTV